MSFLKVLSLVFLFSILACCTSVEEETFCQKTNWQAQGKMDAFEGKTINQYQVYYNNCKYYDVKLNKEAYYTGFQEGLRTFCTAERGKSFGSQGKVYKKQCPAYLEFDFLPSYNKALTDYQRAETAKEKKD